MKNIPPILGAILMIFLFLSGSSVTADNQDLGIIEACNLVLDNSLELEIAHLEKENARFSYEQTRADLKRSESRTAELQNELSLVQSQESFNNTRDDLILDTISSYFDLIIQKQEVKIREKELELDERRLAETEEQVQLGHQSHMDLISQQSSYNSAAFNLEDARQDLIADQESFARDLDRDEVPPLNSELLQQVERVEICQEGFLEEAVEASFELRVQEKQAQIAKLEWERDQARDISSLELKQVENELKIARLEVEKTREDIHHGLKQTFNSFKRAQNNLLLAENSLDEARESHEIILQQEEVGHKTRNQVLSSKISLKNARQSYWSAVSTYYQSILDLKNSMGRDLKEAGHDLFH